MDFLFFNLISYFSNFWQKSAKNVFFLKKSKFWLFFLHNSKYLRLDEKTKTKKKPFLELNILYMMKVTI